MSINKEKTIRELETELSYYKDSSRSWRDKCHELVTDNKYLKIMNDDLKSELTYWNETAEYWKEKSFEFDATTKI